MKKVASTVFLMFLLSFQVCLSADNYQELLVSKDSTKFQFGVSAAMASSGDVLVVWCEETNSSITNFRILAALCKLGANGNYSVGTPTQITINLNSYFSTGAAHNPKRGTWAVVWAHKEGPLGIDGVDLYGAELNANGSIKSGIKEILSNGSSNNVLPYIHWIEKGNKAGGYLLLWTVRKPQSGNSAGVSSMTLDADLKPTSNSTSIFSAPYDADMLSPQYPGEVTDVEQNTNGEFLVGLSAMEQNTLIVRGNIARLNQNGQLISRTRFDEDGDVYPVRLIHLKKQIFITSFWTGNAKTVSFWNRRYLGNLKPKGGAYELLPGRQELLGDIVKLENDKGAYSVLVSGGQIWGQYIRKNGKVKTKKDDPEVIATGANKAAGEVFLAYCLPGTNRIFVLWQHKFTSDQRELRAYVFDPQLN